jgi:hypothetical protein
MRKLPRLPVLVAVTLAVTGVARAGDQSVAVVALEAPRELIFTGKSVSDAVAKDLAAAGGYAVMGPVKVEEKLGREGSLALTKCADEASCVGEKGRKLGVDRIVSGWLARKGNAYRIALVSVDGRTGARLAGVEREIPVASRRLQRDAAAAARSLLGGKPDATGLVEIVTDVPGALVTVDDVPVGTTPVSYAVKPGKHKVQVTRTGWAETEPSWVEVPANGVVTHRPRIFELPARDRPNDPGEGTKVQVTR